MTEVQLAQEECTVTQSPCLLHNWVEERATASLDSPVTDVASAGHAYRHGQRGILTTQVEAHISDCTTNADSYRTPNPDRVQQIGQRQEMLQKHLYHKYSKEIYEASDSSCDTLTVKESTTKRDYQVDGFIPQRLATSKSHNYRTEQAITFWTANVHRIPGVSDIRTRDTAFKRTAAFSTPITEYLNQPLPHGLENYPNL
ncbi:sperm-associated antigen 8 [Pelodytes ibericus]